MAAGLLAQGVQLAIQRDQGMANAVLAQLCAHAIDGKPLGNAAQIQGERGQFAQLGALALQHVPGGRAWLLPGVCNGLGIGGGSAAKAPGVYQIAYAGIERAVAQAGDF